MSVLLQSNVRHVNLHSCLLVENAQLRALKERILKIYCVLNVHIPVLLASQLRNVIRVFQDLLSTIRPAKLSVLLDTLLAKKTSVKNVPHNA